MNLLIENKIITQTECGSNFTYILNDNNDFLSTEYKVLQSQSNSCFVKCMKMLFNGKIQLYYLTQSLKPFSVLIPSLSSENFITIIANIFADVIEVKHNGFLSCQNIDISFEHIFVDPATFKVQLIYLPISKHFYSDNSDFENELRTGLIKLISGVSTLSTPKTMQLTTDLSNGMLTLEDLYNRVKGGNSTGPVNMHNEIINNKKATGLKIIAMNAPARVEIDINKDSFVIGKKADLCDGVVGFNKMISRSHCRVDKCGSQYTVTDLQSANGTYINNVRLQANQPYPIKSGDIIRMANSDFQAVIV